MRFCLLLLCFLLLIGPPAGAQTAVPADSIKQYAILSLDSLSPEDSALLEQYKDSFLLELEDFKTVMAYNKKRTIDTTVALMDKSSHVEVGLDFTSRILSNGRDNGIIGVGFFPSIMYYHKWGFYAATALGFLTDSAIRKSAPVPLFAVTAGFYRTFYRRWSVGINYSRNFSFYADAYERGLLNNSVSVSTGFDFWNYLTVSAGAQFLWSTNRGRRAQDFQQVYSTNVGLSLRKDFRFFNVIGAKVFTLSPELYFLFGNDNSTFVLDGIVNPIRNRPPPLVHDNFFGFLDIEPALYATWRIRNLEISASFHMAIPFNRFSYETNTRTKNPKQYYPYAQAGIKYLFRVKKKVKKPQ